MKITPLPDLNYLKECFVLDPSLPCGLRWSSNRPLSHFKNETMHKRWKTNNSNNPSGCISGNGYYSSRLDKIRYQNHRIVFAIYNNSIDFQGKQIDHIDGNVLNNSPRNLRLVTASQNQFNRKKQKNNLSGHKNISFVKKLDKYRCAMQVDGKDIYIGLFNTVEEAIASRDIKFKQLAGEFYRTI
jgi:hypothetical protein